MRERRGKFAGEIRVIVRAVGDYTETAFNAGIAFTNTGLDDTSLHMDLADVARLDTSFPRPGLYHEYYVRARR